MSVVLENVELDEVFSEGLGLKPPDNIICMKGLNDLAFYNIIQNATMVLLPLVWLTGTSMRLVEALYFGKPVITTSVVASRLSNFANGLHCIIEDHFKNYPSHVKTIRNDCLILNFFLIQMVQGLN